MVKEFLSLQGVPYEVRLLTDPTIRSEIAEHRTVKGPLTVDASTDTLFVSCFDANAVIMLDARTGAPRGGDLTSASIPVLDGGHGA
jgi:hypothetical protein